MRILAFHAHPDDAEALAGGTLTLLAGQGHQIVIATMTPGDCGSAEDHDACRVVEDEVKSPSSTTMGADGGVMSSTIPSLVPTALHPPAPFLAFTAK